MGNKSSSSSSNNINNKSSNKSSSASARLQRANASGVLTLNDMGLTSWKKLISYLRQVEKARSMNLRDNCFKKPLPPALLSLPLWGTLVTVDLSHCHLKCVCALGDPAVVCCSHLGNSSEMSPPEASLAHSHPSLLFSLETINISHNNLHALPLSMGTLLARLKHLVCTDNATPLELPAGGLAAVMGHSHKSSLQTVNLSNNGLKHCSLWAPPASGSSRGSSRDAGSGVEPLQHHRAQFPALEEVILEGNELTGTFRIAAESDEALIFPALKRISIAHRGGSVSSIDPEIYSMCPTLRSLTLTGLRNEGELWAQLAKTKQYQQWQVGHADVLNKKFANGGDASLMP